jgi:ferredoxin like protein
MTIEDKLAKNPFKNDGSSHITLDQSICIDCRERFCIYSCPAHLYSLNEQTCNMQVEFAGCLECGTCMVACTYGAVTWSYPRGGFGVQYRYG